MTILAHHIALDPTVDQVISLSRACGVARFTWNWALSTWTEQYKAGEKPTAAKLKLLWNRIKRERFPWIYESPKGANQQPFTNLQKAFLRFFQKKAKYPSFKKKGIRDSFYVENDKLAVAEKSVRLPVIGTVRTREELRFVGKIMGASVSREADRWFISIQVDLVDSTLSRVEDRQVGIDLGLTNFVTLSSGEKIEAPKPLRAAIENLRRKQKILARRQKGSNRRAKSCLQVARLHRRVKNIRRDFLHKLSTRICRENQAVVIEDLNVKGMVKNRRLARAISDAGWSEFRRQLEYKSLRYGTRIVVAGRFYPSTKRCSKCGSLQDMPLKQRTYQCAACGFICDRDVNAARNLEQLITPGLGVDARGLEGSGPDRKTRTKPCQDEARTTPRVKSQGLTK